MPRCVSGRRSSARSASRRLPGSIIPGTSCLCFGARGLTTSPIPYGDRVFQLDFDFLDQVLRASTSDGGRREIALFPRSVADFYTDLMHTLSDLGIEVRIHEVPNEIRDAIRFSEDHVHAAYDRELAQRFWRILVQSGSFLLGKLRSGGNAFFRVAHHRFPPPAACRISQRRWFSTLIPMRSAAPASGREVRASTTPPSIPMPRRRRPTSTYEAAASAGNWDRAALECPLGVPGKPRRV